MFCQRMKTDQSIIFSSDEQYEKPLSKIHSFQFFKSNEGSPLRSQFLKSQKDQSQDQIAQLSESLYHERSLRTNLTVEMSNIYNQMRASSILTNQLQTTKNKLLEEMRGIQKKCEKAQEERNKYIQRNMVLKHQITLLRGTIEVNEEQIFNLTSQNKKLIDQLNFQKEMGSQSQKDNLMLRAQIQTMLRNYKNTLEDLQKNQLRFEIIDQISLKTKQLQGEVQCLRIEVEGIFNIVKSNEKFKDQIFTYSEQLQEKIKATNNELNKVKNTKFRSYQAQKLKVQTFKMQTQYSELLQEKQNQIENLKEQLIKIQKINKELEDGWVDGALGLSALNISNKVPQMLTNTQYLNKMMKQNFHKNQEVQKLSDRKDDRIQKLKQKLIEEENKSKNYLLELERKQSLFKYDKKNVEMLLNQEIDQAKQDNSALKLKIEELKEKQKRMKEEILEKDTIIMNYVQKKKEEKVL